MITEPIWIEMPRTYRDYDMYRLECARARGWNEAMECIFAQEFEEQNKRITSCRVIEKNIGTAAICKTCQNRERCEVTT